MRQVVLDTETTGLRVEGGHRIVEIGCLELIHRKITDRHFHSYLNPEREVDAGALAVHGITTVFLKDKPVFSSIAQDFIDFISGAELIIHNAPFDLSFLDYELGLIGRGFKSVADYCAIIDTLVMARSRHAGQRNSLDALCKRYHIDLSKRDLHGALLDAHLLAQVYLAMTGGQGSFFEGVSKENKKTNEWMGIASSMPLQKQHSLVVIKASAEEITEHEKYLKILQEQGKCVWLEEDQS